jgi:predicted nucleic acid-binding protein
MNIIFIDTNIFIYAAGEEHPNKQPSINLLKKIASDKKKAVISSEILQEILHRYLSINDKKRGLEIFDDCVKIIQIILPVNKNDAFKAREMLEKYDLIKARDAIHASVMINRGIKIIASFDKHFECIKEINWIEH